MPDLDRLLRWVVGLPPVLVYVLVGAGAALENVFPPVPSDTFVLLGAVLAERGVVGPVAVGAVAWACNVASALFVYAMARRYGRGIFETRWGHWLLRPHQLERLSEFYGRYGLATIFASRFLPVFRVLVPAFAGISGLRFWSAAVPLAAASALWYGVLLYFGMLAARNLYRLLDLFSAVNNWLLAAAGLALALVAAWWWRTRRRRDEDEEPEDDEEEEREAPRAWWPEEPG